MLGMFLLHGAEARAEVRVFGQRPNLANSVLRRGPIFGRGNFNLNFFNNGRIAAKPVNGFSKLAQLGNNILEQNVDQFGRLTFRRLFIDRVGRVIGATSRETIRQLQEFFLSNFDNFGQGAQNTISRFLLRDPVTRSALFGNVAIDFSGFELPDIPNSPYNKQQRLQAGVAALNFCLNSVNTRRGLVRMTPAQVGADGVMRVNLRGLMSPQAIALLFNPRESSYDCEGRGVMSLDEVLSRCMDNDIYYQLLGLDKKLENLGRQLGIATDPRQTVRNKTLIAGTTADPQSQVGINPERLLERQPEANNPGGCYFRSYDFFGNNSSGSKRRSKDVFRAGVNFTQDADEFIFHLPNGFMGFYLADKDGNRQNAAPGSIAFGTNNITNGAGPSGNAEVNNPLSCLSCHKDGFIAGRISKKDKQTVYTDHFKNGNIRVDRGFFANLDEYERDAKRCSDITRNSMIRSGSCIPDPDPKHRGECRGILPEFLQQYRQALTPEQAMRRLGMCGTGRDAMINAAAGEAQCKGRALPPQLRPFFAQSKNNKNELRIDRGRFEDNFCQMKRLAGTLGVTGGGIGALGGRTPARSFGITGGADGQSHLR